MEIAQEIKISKERVPILVGKKGEIKKELQRKLDIKLEINSDTGLIIITGDDGLKVHNGEIIIKAIGRGFNPDIAMTLLENDNIFELIDISEYSRGSKDRLHELRSRLIGTEGRCKRTIEKSAGVDLCIYEKTVGIIGKTEGVEVAKKAIEKLLGGSTHGKVYGYLERQIKKN